MATEGWNDLIWRVASMPLSTGIEISIRMTSGTSFCAILTASSPSLASPTTLNSASRESDSCMLSRTTAWSSASKIFIKAN